jgi:hypothetical protein
MAVSPAVLLLDDGELDDVQEILDAARVPYGRVRGGAIVSKTPPPSRLLVSTPRRIEAVHLPEPGDPEAEGLVRIVVVSEDSTTLRARLREVGFDYLVRRPVHPEALRLLLLHCLYAGEERRAEPRVPVGFEVSFRTGLLPRRATLADLSTRGCRLLSKWALEPGKRITVTIPQRAGVAESIAVKGRVIRMSLDERLGAEGPYSTAVAFEPVSAEVRHELEWILEERARGPATLRLEGEEVEPRATPAAPEPPLDPPETRSDDLVRGVSVEVDVRLDARDAAPEPEPVAEAQSETPSIAAAESEPSCVAETEPEGPSVAEEAAGMPAEDEPTAQTHPDDRRGSRRGAYPRRVPAFGDRAMRVLVARDLSMGGMRVERDSGLQMGDRLHLAIYGDANEEPFLVWATVTRDDGPDGLALVFDGVHPMIAEQLEKVVTDLPAVESLHDDEARAMGTVITEILDDQPTQR